jgi:hypothetical protein
MEQATNHPALGLHLWHPQPFGFISIVLPSNVAKLFVGASGDLR